MTGLEVRLLGGFEVRLGDSTVGGFESQKARALLAYLVLQPGRSATREQLAGLLWPDRPEESARRNLRQALYSIRSTLTQDASGADLFVSNHQTIRLNPELPCWTDAEAFSEAIAIGLDGEGADPHQLATAATLYSGDLLAGFFVKDSAPFEEWLVTHQERLREEAISAFRTLVDSYLSRGEYRYGIQYARRLLAIDPLSEGANRQLMRLYALAGRRNRALAQYEQLRNLLNSELAVEPIEETAALYRSILLEEIGPADTTNDEPIGPLIPMVGRKASVVELQESWDRALQGHGHLTILEGEAGVGKSRLAKSFVDGATAKTRAIVLHGRSYPSAPRIGYQLISEILLSAFADVLADEVRGRQRLSAELVADLCLLAPELRRVCVEALELEPDLELADAGRAGQSILELFKLLVQQKPATVAVPLILLLDDLQWADHESLELLEEMVRQVETLPVWILATVRSGAGPDHPITQGPATKIVVDRLEPEAIDEICQALVDLAAANDLAGFIWRHSGGLPLAVAELINYLWDEGILVPQRPGQWTLTGKPDALLSPPTELGKLIELRVQRLPTSARRLIALAAVLGQQFDADMLQRAGDEHLGVVETCVELMLERWLIRQFPRYWSQAGRERDVVLWARGARRGSFEFAHKAIRDATLSAVNPLRRSYMHREASACLRRTFVDDLEAVAEQIAFHDLEAGEWQAALPHVKVALAKSLSRGAHATALWYGERALKVVAQLVGGVERLAEREQLEAERQQILEQLPALAREPA